MDRRKMIYVIFGFSIAIFFIVISSFVSLGVVEKKTRQVQKASYQTVGIYKDPVHIIQNIASFNETDQSICREEKTKKPRVYLFTRASCEECRVIENNFKETISPYIENDSVAVYGFDLDTGTNTFGVHQGENISPSDQSLFMAFSPLARVPVVVVGCRYMRDSTITDSEAIKFKKSLSYLIDQVLLEP